MHFVPSVLTTTIPWTKPTSNGEHQQPETLEVYARVSSQKKAKDLLSCKGLNAMANCGIIPHDGHFTYEQLYPAMLKMGFSKPLAMMLSKQAVGFSKESPASLANIGNNCPNQHDGSLSRDDKALSDATELNPKRFRFLCSMAQMSKSGQPVLTVREVAMFKLIVEEHSRQYNQAYSLTLQLRILSLINADNLIHTMGRNGEITIEDLRSWFEQERIPQTWTPPVGYGFIASLSNAKALHSEMAKLAKEMGPDLLRQKVVELQQALTALE